jgi:hypothetical protein
MKKSVIGCQGLLHLVVLEAVENKNLAILEFLDNYQLVDLDTMATWTNQDDLTAFEYLV